jgi:hypothetical protein
MKHSCLPFATVLAALVALAPAAEPKTATPALKPDADGWIRLFNGKDLQGWVQNGGKADYRVENAEIVGTSRPNTPNSFLCTAHEYGDFVLEVEFKIQPGLNAGVQIRSHCFAEAKEFEWKGKTIKVPAGRVHGYQVEIDASARAWSAGIYDEGRRGWLNDLKDNPAAQKAFKQNEWNKFRIECRGDSIKTWINGAAAADLKDSMTPRGFIALQVHGVGKKEEAMEVRYRNVRLQDLGTK